MALIIFLKFPSFRILLNQHLFQPQCDFILFYNRLCACDDTLDLWERTMMGYTVLNSQIVSTAPIIFCVDIKKMYNFITSTKFQGIIFRVSVSGKFAPLALFGHTFNDLKIVIRPKDIKIFYHMDREAKLSLQLLNDDVLMKTDNIMDAQIVKHFNNILHLDKMIMNDNTMGLQKILQENKHLITNGLLTKLISSYQDVDDWEIKFLFDVLNFQDTYVLTVILFNAKRQNINMKKIFYALWLEFIQHNIVDQISMVTFGEIFQEVINSIYSTNITANILSNGIPEWKKYIAHYVLTSDNSKTGKIENNLLTNANLDQEHAVQNCSHFYETLCGIDDSLTLKEEQKVGYTILYSQILSASPTIFSQYIKNIFDFWTSNKTNNSGVMFQVTVCGKFLSMDNGLYLVIIPKDIKISPQDTDFERYNVVQLREIIDRNNDDAIALRKVLQGLRHLFTTKLLQSLLSLYNLYAKQTKWITELLCNYSATNTNILTDFLLNIKKLNVNNIVMEELYWGIWLNFIDNNIDKMSIIKLRKKFTELDEEETPGELLLGYKTSGILNKIPADIKHIEWIKYFEHYVCINCFPQQIISVTEQKFSNQNMSEQQRVQKFLDIMFQYDKIINKAAKYLKNSIQEEEEEKTHILNTNNLKTLFDFID
eukprot:38670_1